MLRKENFKLIISIKLKKINMTEEMKKALELTVRALKSKGGLANKEIKPVIITIEKLIRRKTIKKSKRA